MLLHGFELVVMRMRTPLMMMTLLMMRAPALTRMASSWPRWFETAILDPRLLALACEAFLFGYFLVEALMSFFLKASSTS